MRTLCKFSAWQQNITCGDIPWHRQRAFLMILYTVYIFNETMYNKRKTLFETLSIWIKCSEKRSLCHKLFIDKFPQMCFQTISNPRKISLELFAWYINSFSLLKVFVCGSSTLSGQMIVRWCLLKDWCLLCIFRNAPGYSTHCVDLKTSNVHSKRINTRFFCQYNSSRKQAHKRKSCFTSTFIVVINTMAHSLKSSVNEMKNNKLTPFVIVAHTRNSLAMPSTVLYTTTSTITAHDLMKRRTAIAPDSTGVFQFSVCDDPYLGKKNARKSVCPMTRTARCYFVAFSHSRGFL